MTEAKTKNELSRCKLLGLVYQAIRSSVVANLFLSLILVIFFWERVDHATLMLWYAGMVAVSIYRLRIRRAYSKEGCTPFNVGHFERLQRFGVAATALIWGIGIWLLFPEKDLDYQFFLTFVVVGLTAGASTSLSADRWGATLFDSTILGTLCLLFLTSPNTLSQAIGVMTVAYLAFLLASSRRVHTILQETIVLQEENEATSERLRQSEKKVRLIFDQVNIAIFFYDCSLKIIDVNATFYRTLGVSKNDLIGMDMQKIKDGRILDALKAPCRKGYAKNGYYEGEYQATLGSRRLWIKMQTSPITNEKGEIIGAIGMVEDISKEKEAEKRVELFAKFYTQNPNPVLRVEGRSGKILLENDAAKRLRVELKKKNPDPWQKMIGEIVRHPEISQYTLRAKGKVFQFDVLRIDRNSLNLYGRDVSSEYEARAEADYLAYFDELTGLPRRNLLFDHITLAVHQAKRNGSYNALLYLDLDNFKQINDTMGHDIGDKLLIEVAHRIKNTLRQSDTVSRLGGDEFAVLITDLDPPIEQATFQARLIAQKILERLRTPFAIKGRQLFIGASVGITLFRQKKNPYDLLKEADTAMYKAKQEGKNGVYFFNQSLAAAISHKAEILEHIHKALQRDEFELFYQPQVDIRSGKAIAVEALLRWESEALGSVSPSEFIPIAEEGGLIHELGRWVAKRACRDIKKLDDLLEYVAINVSAREFARSDFVDSITAIIQAEGIAPQKIELELTESILLKDIQSTQKKMATLQKAGIKLAIDDFGTGYSSLSYLKKLPVESLKIDRAFVRDIGIDRNDEKLVETIIDIANHFGMHTVAEGVESKEQLSFLEKIGCERIQGFYTAKEMPLNELLQWLSGHRERKDGGF
jgi:diguanylate cyclase (GGDEF)-like protein/PAS domain S-box-containing protein